MVSTDAAGNSSSIPGLNALIIDTTPPVIPTVVPLITNNQRPTLNGTFAEGTDLLIEIDGRTYSLGDGFLMTPGDGTWSVDLLVSGQLLNPDDYDVIVTSTDTAGNAANDATTDEIVVDVTAPVLPTVNELITNNTQPTLIGTFEVGTALTVTIDGRTYELGDGFLTSPGDGTWSLDLAAADQTLNPTMYDVTVASTDTAGNRSTDNSFDELTIDIQAPVIPTVNLVITNNQQPVLTGTYESGTVLEVSLDGQTYSLADDALTVTPDGRWSLDLAVAGQSLNAGSFDVTAVSTDAAGNRSNDATNAEVTIDLTAPAAPTVDSLLTNNQQPTLTGSYEPGSQLSVTVDGVTYSLGDGFLSTTATGQWSLDLSAANQTLPSGPIDVLATSTDDVGNSINDLTLDEIIIDITPPAIPTVNTLLTNNPQPVISGTVDQAADLVIEIGGRTFQLGIDPGLRLDAQGRWFLDLAQSNINVTEGDNEVRVTATDLAGNSSTDQSLLEVTLDTVPPIIPTVDFLVVSDVTPTLSGTSDPLADLTVEVDGIIYTLGVDPELTRDAQGAWTLDIPSGNELNEDTFDVIVISTDPAGNISNDETMNELRIDLTPPLVTVTSQITNDTTPTITGSITEVPQGVAGFSVTVNGTTYTLGVDDELTLVTFPLKVWTLNLDGVTAMAEDTYEVVASVTDSAGNRGVDTSQNELIIDITAPTVTIDNTISNDGLPTITGTLDDITADLTVTVAGVTYQQGVNPELTVDAQGFWSLDLTQLSTPLADDGFEVIASAIDSANNEGTDGTTLELYVDTIVPIVVVNDLVTPLNNPVITGTISEPQADLSVTIDGRTYRLGIGFRS